MPVECWSSLGWQQWQGKEEGEIWMQTGRQAGLCWGMTAHFFPSNFDFPWTCNSPFFLRWYTFFFFHLYNQREVNFLGNDDSDDQTLIECFMCPHDVCGLYSMYDVVLLKMMDAIWCCRDIVSSHVFVHLRETLLDVVLRAAFSHCGKSKPLRGMVQLQERGNEPRWYYTFKMQQRCCV